MALVRVTLGGKRLGYVRNNKSGSTTIINYLGQLLWNEKQDQQPLLIILVSFSGMKSPQRIAGPMCRIFVVRIPTSDAREDLNPIIKNLKRARFALRFIEILLTRSLQDFIIARNTILISTTWIISFRLIQNG